MATFYEVKKLICKMFGYNNIGDNDDDLEIEIKRRWDSRECTFLLINQELKKIYNEIVSNKEDTLELFAEHKYEIAIHMDSPVIRRVSELPISDDFDNHMQYSLGYCSVEYCIYILVMLINRKNFTKAMHDMFMISYRIKNGQFPVKEGEEIDWKKALIYGMREYSIKITCESSWNVDTARRKKTAYIFEFMYKTGFALLEYVDLEDMFPSRKMRRDIFNVNSLDNVPHREYIDDVVDYYRVGIASTDPYIQFISFYHIIEFFYDEVFKQKIVSDLRDKLTHPDFSYKDDQKVYDIVRFTKGRLKMNEELGSGNELQSLIYVLQEFIDISTLKSNLLQTNKDSIIYYQGNKVSFAKAPSIQWNDSNGVSKNIAKRIYYVRNALVHSKSGKNEERYKPYKDEKELLREIPLIKTIAEMIIIGSSKII